MPHNVLNVSLSSYFQQKAFTDILKSRRVIMQTQQSETWPQRRWKCWESYTLILQVQKRKLQVGMGFESGKYQCWGLNLDVPDPQAKSPSARHLRSSSIMALAYQLLPDKADPPGGDPRPTPAASALRMRGPTPGSLLTAGPSPPFPPIRCSLAYSPPVN